MDCKFFCDRGKGKRIFCQLGFTSKSTHATYKEVSLISMLASFCIWLASNSHEWIQPPLVGTHENPMEDQRKKYTKAHGGGDGYDGLLFFLFVFLLILSPSPGRRRMEEEETTTTTSSSPWQKILAQNMKTFSLPT